MFSEQQNLLLKKISQWLDLQMEDKWGQNYFSGFLCVHTSILISHVILKSVTLLPEVQIELYRRIMDIIIFTKEWPHFLQAQ